MRKLWHVGVILGVIALLLGRASLSEAVWEYQYTGLKFSVGAPFQPTFATGVYSLEDQITGTLLIGEGEVCVVLCTVDFLAYTFTDGHQTLTETNSSAIFRFMFSTSGAAIPFGDVPIDWSFEIGSASGGMTAGGGGDIGEIAWLGASTFSEASSAGGHSIHLGSSVWTVQRVPEAPTAVLIAIVTFSVGHWLVRATHRRTSAARPATRREEMA